jgi:hypothetical protein
LITVNVPDSFLSLLDDGSLTIAFDDTTTGAGDGYAIDFIKLLINPGTVVNTGTITGTVVDDVTDLPIAGATVSAGGVVEDLTDANGQYTLDGVPAGLAVILVSASGYAPQIVPEDLVAGDTLEVDFRLTASTAGDGECSADGVCNEGCPIETPDPDCAEVCTADGFCNENCSDLDPDPDCDMSSGGDPQCTARSTFESGDEAWTLEGDAEGGRAEPDYNFAGGNPGAFISADDDAAGGVWYFRAPAKFLGDFSGAYGRTLTFDLQQSSLSNQFNGRDVILMGNGLLIWFDTANNPGLEWTSYSVTIDAAAGWFLNDDTPASEAQIREVLATIDDLRIRGEFVSGADTGGLDNVVLNSDCP